MRLLRHVAFLCFLTTIMAVGTLPTAARTVDDCYASRETCGEVGGYCEYTMTPGFSTPLQCLIQAESDCNGICQDFMNHAYFSSAGVIENIPAEHCIASCSCDCNDGR